MLASCKRILHCFRSIVRYIGYGHDEPKPTDTEVTAKPNLSAYIVTENLECGTLRDLVLNQVGCNCLAASCQQINLVATLLHEHILDNEHQM